MKNEYKQPETRIRECILTTNNGDVTKQYFPEAWTGGYENKWSFLFKGKKEFITLYSSVLEYLSILYEGRILSIAKELPAHTDLNYILSLIEIQAKDFNVCLINECFLDLNKCKKFIDWYLKEDYNRWLNDYGYVENNYIKYP